MPGKDVSEAAHYRPISLLSVTSKIFERLVLERIQPAINKIIPVEQSEFRKNRGCIEQVMALTTFIENGYQNKLKTNITLIDISAAYDIVWRHGLLLKLAKTITCKTIVELIDKMLLNQQFQVFMGNRKPML